MWSFAFPSRTPHKETKHLLNENHRVWHKDCYGIRWHYMATYNSYKTLQYRFGYNSASSISCWSVNICPGLRLGGSHGSPVSVRHFLFLLHRRRSLSSLSGWEGEFVGVSVFSVVSNLRIPVLHGITFKLSLSSESHIIVSARDRNTTRIIR